MLFFNKTSTEQNVMLLKHFKVYYIVTLVVLLIAWGAFYASFTLLPFSHLNYRNGVETGISLYPEFLYEKPFESCADTGAWIYCRAQTGSADEAQVVFDELQPTISQHFTDDAKMDANDSNTFIWMGILSKVMIISPFVGCLVLLILVLCNIKKKNYQFCLKAFINLGVVNLNITYGCAMALIMHMMRSLFANIGSTYQVLNHINNISLYVVMMLLFAVFGIVTSTLERKYLQQTVQPPKS